MKRTFLAATLLLAACTEPVDVALFKYQGCRKQMTKEFIDQGTEPVAANMKAKAYCEEQMAK
jgi:hypothetical protein